MDEVSNRVDAINAASIRSTYDLFNAGHNPHIVAWHASKKRLKRYMCGEGLTIKQHSRLIKKLMLRRITVDQALDKVERLSNG